jgi:sugar/nucleoside kinase (ribokinase family)
MLIFVRDLSKLRVSAGVASPPLVLWEPVPASCISGSQDIHLQTAKYVDVYSPNHLELLASFASGAGDGPPAEFGRQRIEEQVRRILQSGIGRNADGAAVIRCGEHGCMVAARSYPIRWIPAFHKLSASRIVDVTGAGNAFFGAFAVTLSITSGLTEATVAGSVAASFVIEQVGLPHKTTHRTARICGTERPLQLGTYRGTFE